MLFIDSHVHIHPCFDMRIFFNCALSNINHYAGHLPKQNFDKVLLLTESGTVNIFDRLIHYSKDKSSFSEFDITVLSDGCSVLIKNRFEDALFILAGRQIVTNENLEILALGTSSAFLDGEPLNKTIQAIKNDNALPVLPWGFGKWTGVRGKIIDQYLNGAAKEDEIFLGDNGNRLNGMPLPKQFKIAERKDIRILPGSDPLPFVSQQSRGGSYGFSLEGRLVAEKPKESLFALLRNNCCRPTPYGIRTNLFSFFYFQCAMQIKKYKSLRNRS